MSERVSIEIADGVANVRLSRPEKMNALDGAMFQALVDAGHDLADNQALRSVVLSGEGACFCAGLDFGSFQAMSEDQDSEASGLIGRNDSSVANFAQSAAWVWHELPVPVIAAIHGVAFGGGLQIALGADLRIVAPDARLSIREIHWGLVPDMAGPQLLRHLMPLDRVKELTFTGREVSGIEAVEIGLATRLSDDPLETAMALAREIAQSSPHAIRSAKYLLDHAAELSVAEGLALEESSQRALMRSPNQVESVMANFEKRAPVFRDVD